MDLMIRFCFRLTQPARPAPFMVVLCALAFVFIAPMAQAQESGGEWKSLFDGETLTGWEETDFFGKGDVHVEDGTLVLGTGILTGVNWTSDFPKSNFEIRLEASRVKGNDFFCGLTFPVKDSFATWVVGGWGGKLVGLSSIDWLDASENETASGWDFENGRWYALLLRVTDDNISAWIDGELAFSVDLEGRTISLREGEIDLSIPLGFATYSTVGALRNIEYRTLDAQ